MPSPRGVGSERPIKEISADIKRLSDELEAAATSQEQPQQEQSEQSSGSSEETPPSE